MNLLLKLPLLTRSIDARSIDVPAVTVDDPGWGLQRDRRFLAASLAPTSALTPTSLQWYLFGAIFTLGAAYTLRKNGHVRVDVLQSRLSPKAKAWIDLIGIVIFMIPFCAMVFWLSLPWVINSWHLLEMSSDPGACPLPN